MSDNKQHADVIIIGGSFAGLAAAMPLVRARRKVIVIDAGSPRNRFAKVSQGIFGLDGLSPSQIGTTAIEQLQQYATFQLLKDTALSAYEKPDETDANAQPQFVVSTQQHGSLQAKRLIIASGITDKLPDIPGLEIHWGKSVLHCPYCHGFELSDRPLGILASGEMSFHQAAMIPDWNTPNYLTTLFTQGKFTPEGDTLTHLQNRGVSIEHTPIKAVNGNGERIHTVSLQDGRNMPLQGLYVAPTITLVSPLITMLNLQVKETPMGTIVSVDEMKQSSTKGVFVAGDISNPMQNGTLAISSGMMAGVAAHRSLIFGV